MPKDLPEDLIVQSKLFEKLCKRMAKRMETFLAFNPLAFDESRKIFTDLLTVFGGVRSYRQFREEPSLFSLLDFFKMLQKSFRYQVGMNRNLADGVLCLQFLTGLLSICGWIYIKHPDPFIVIHILTLQLADFFQPHSAIESNQRAPKIRRFGERRRIIVSTKENLLDISQIKGVFLLYIWFFISQFQAS